MDGSLHHRPPTNRRPAQGACAIKLIRYLVALAGSSSTGADCNRSQTCSSARWPSGSGYRIGCLRRRSSPVQRRPQHAFPEQISAIRCSRIIPAGIRWASPLSPKLQARHVLPRMFPLSAWTRDSVCKLPRFRPRCDLFDVKACCGGVPTGASVHPVSTFFCIPSPQK
jgi:hypothetical protein